MFIPLRLEWGDVQGDFWLYGMESLWLCGGRVQQSSFEHNTEPVFRPPGECGACGVNPDKQRSQLLFSEFFNGDTAANHKGLCRRQNRRLPQACVPCMQDDIFSDVRVHASFGARDAVCSGVVAQGRSRQHRGVCSADTDGRTGHLRVISDNDACAGDRKDSTVPRRCRRTSTLQSARRVSPAEAGFSAVFGHGGAGGDLGACDRRPACHNELAFALLSSEVRRQSGASACPRRCAVGVASNAHCVEVQRVVPAVFRHGDFKRGGVIPVVSVCRAGQGREERSDGGHFQKNKEDCMTQVTERTLCCGCSACQSVCPQNAISMKPDALGFLYPEIAQDKCVDCGLCARTCPVNRRDMNKNQGRTAYALINASDEIRMESSSGGAFTLLAEKTIDDGGVVFGARFDPEFNVVHGWTETRDGLAEFRGSKYVQSDMGGCLSECRAFLEAGRSLLFSGTPCQCAALRSFLGKDYGNLTVVDFICHGVPSPALWQRYKIYREKNSASRVVKTAFRRKNCGWKQYSLQFTFANCSEYCAPLDKDEYLQVFLHDAALRESCYACPAKGRARHSDLTLADFWGVDRVLPDFFDDRGTSLVCVNSDRGGRLLDSVRMGCRIVETDLDVAVGLNASFAKSAARPKKRDSLEGDLHAMDFGSLYRKYGRDGFFRRARRLVGRCARRLKRLAGGGGR